MPSYKLFQSSDLVRVLEGREAGTGKGMVDVWDQRYGNDEVALGMGGGMGGGGGGG